jgi:HEAT repeat protein
MEKIKVFVKTVLQTVPPWLIITIAAVIGAALLALILGTVISRSLFRSRLRRVTKDPDLADSFIKGKYNQQSLLNRSSLIERFARNTSVEIIRLTGVDDLWIDNLLRQKKKRDFLRILKFAPQKGLFKCFCLSLDKKQFGPILIKWLTEQEDYLYLRSLALSGKGEYFDGQEALSLFKENVDQIREMTGDPEWASRYFAYKILIHDSDDRSQRAIWEGFHDPHPHVRTTIAGEFRTEGSDRLYSELYRLFLSDPSFEVRKAAWDRIHKDFSNLYSLDAKRLTHEEAYHALELLRTGSNVDENFALSYLDNNDLELRLMAARFLENSGSLERLCFEVDLGDREAMERNFKLLKNASEVRVTSFLNVIERIHNPATLLLCARILKDTGDRSLITELSRRVFRIMDSDSKFIELYSETLESISRRGNDESLRLLDRELVRRKDNEELLGLILSAIPERSDAFSLDTLFLFLKDPDVKAKEALRGALRRMPTSLVLPEVLDILKTGRDRYPHIVRVQALLLLGEMQMPYCLQTILENLPILPLDEAREFAKILSRYPKDIFSKKAENLLQSTDSTIRSVLISCLPSTGDQGFLPSIRRSIKDADPEVRIASIWALVEFGDTRSVNQAFSMLRDPVDRVRIEASKALGANGSDDTLNRLTEILDDENEIDLVKEAAVLGLGTSTSTKAIDILTNKLEQDEPYETQVIGALTKKTSKNELTHLTENFKDASQRVRDKLKEAFKGMKEEGEQAMVELLREDIASLKPFVAEILEGTGFVESTIRKLKHRDTSVRRDAAEELSLIGSESAFRGMVLAARDPDEEVRVKVIKALEKLETKEGKSILTALENDPDKRIRRYTHWALERLRSKSL